MRIRDATAKTASVQSAIAKANIAPNQDHAARDTGEASTQYPRITPIPQNGSMIKSTADKAARRLEAAFWANPVLLPLIGQRSPPKRCGSIGRFARRWKSSVSLTAPPVQRPMAVQALEISYPTIYISTIHTGF